jgi:hypothetical protein
VLQRFSLLLVTDPLYPAVGRRYGDEDVWLANQLRSTFDVATCSPLDAEALVDRFDLVLVRNTGPVMNYHDAYLSFREHAQRSGTRLVTDLGAKGDALGKGHLLELSRAGAPVIPTIDRREDLGLLPPGDLLLKLLLGSDSHGMRVVSRDALPDDLTGYLIQPMLDIEYEVSYVYVDSEFQYALRTGESRWDLQQFQPTVEELIFAKWFIDWNDVVHGVQRVDACRTRDGQLLLVELEDLNPYLSLDTLDHGTRQRFVEALTHSLLASAGPIPSDHQQF